MADMPIVMRLRSKLLKSMVSERSVAATNLLSMLDI